MRISDLRTDEAVLAELGRRLAQQRLERNLTQERLAEDAGIGRATLQRLEDGRSVQLSSLVKLLRALDLFDALDAAVPERVELPIARLEREQRRARQRARASRTPRPVEGRPPRWTWGDEQG